MGVMDEGNRLLTARGRVMQLVEGAGLGTVASSIVLGDMAHRSPPARGPMVWPD
jgi:hypothetical protein